ncbi:hypothetical protein VNO78_10872 [Psophocarpus tetragonolobus]|uniref:Uncharacterized protein n=1 Tax=Psophocarpus tetragonolobus TaxID=3891 RepID=A0AAN9XMM1_PSOTE
MNLSPKSVSLLGIPLCTTLQPSSHSLCFLLSPSLSLILLSTPVCCMVKVPLLKQMIATAMPHGGGDACDLIRPQQT